MTTVFLCPISTIFQWFTDAGIILSGGKVNTYLGGTVSTPQVTYTDVTGVTPNSNPIILGSNGRLNGVQIWQPQGISLKLVITDANNVQLGPVFDQITGINDPTTVQTLYSNPATGFGADLIANAVRSYDLFSSLRAANAPSLAAGQTLVVDVQAGTVPGDGIGGLFYWNAAISATDDGMNVIKPNSVSGAGRYLRQRIAVSSSFTATLTGMTGTVTGPMSYQIYAGFLVALQSGGIAGTSAAGAPGNAMTLTGLPAAIIPSSFTTAQPCVVTDNGVNKGGWGSVAPSGVITYGLGFDNNITGFTSGGAKGVPSSSSFLYTLR